MEREDGVARKGSSESPTPISGDDEQKEGGLESNGIGNWLPSADVENANPPWLIEVTGDIGIKLGALSLALAIGGIVAGWLRIQPLANLAIVSSLGLIGIAMVLGMTYQVFVLRS